MVSLDHLTKRFGTQTAVDAISIEIPAGQIVGFLGPNGAGKTTTLRMLATLLTPTAGTASVTVTTPAPGGGTSAPATFTIH